MGTSYLSYTSHVYGNDLTELHQNGDLQTLIDEVMERLMAEYQVPNAVVSIVKDGEIFLSKGYGYQDIARGIAVNPYTSLFTIGSTSNLFNLDSDHAVG